MRPLWFLGIVLVLSGSFTASSRQEEQGPAPKIEPAFSSKLLPSLGYPLLTLRETGEGLEGFPRSLPAGRYHVRMTAPATSPVHMILVQYPQALTQEQAEKSLIDAAAHDQPGEGWVYGGGAFAMPGTTIDFFIDLEPGNWHVAATRESVRPTGGCGGSSQDRKVEEWATLQPLRVVAGTLPPEPAVSASVEMQDTAFELPDTVSAGPQIWRISATGTQPRNLIFFRTPQHLTADDLRLILTAPKENPPEGLPSFNDFIWAGDVSITSPGYSTWVEFDLKPGHYLLTSWTADAETGAPALFLGMAKSVTVQ